MRRSILALAVVGIGIAAVGVTTLLTGPGLVRAQTRRISPHESTSGQVEGADLTIVYGRPSMRGRVIFGSLVPYGVVWCPGADEATTLESTRPIRIGALDIPAGPHTIWILPAADRSTLIVSKEPSGFHTRYNPSADLGRVELTKRELEQPVEQLTFSIEPSASGGGTIKMVWEKTELSAQFAVVQ